ncbi:hypothetical protein ASL14_02745 [Paenibacillus sp. IHB B 3084]|nr:hypothetical protein ASL14_02745 [Paenibacillus sp. IHB B 3084]
MYVCRELWRYFVGSTISGLAVTSNEGMLAVGTCDGMLHVIDLQSGTKRMNTASAPLQSARQGVGSSGVTMSHCAGNTNILQMRIKAKSVKLTWKNV